MSRYGIDDRVWRKVAVFSNSGPDWIALAACVCPEMLEEDIAWSPYDSLTLTETSSVAIECGTQSMAIRNALVEWAKIQIGAELVVHELAQWDLKLGVWCAAACVETALKHVAAGDNRPRMAVETARRWVLGRATMYELQDAYLNAGKIGGLTGPASDLALAARQLIGAAAGIRPGMGPDAVRWAVMNTADANITHLSRFPESSYGPAREKEERRLLKTVAGAIISYPTIETINASRGLVSGRTLLAGAVGAAVGAGIMLASKRS